MGRRKDVLSPLAEGIALKRKEVTFIGDLDTYLPRLGRRTQEKKSGRLILRGRLICQRWGAAKRTGLNQESILETHPRGADVPLKGASSTGKGHTLRPIFAESPSFSYLLERALKKLNSFPRTERERKIIYKESIHYRFSALSWSG